MIVLGVDPGAHGAMALYSPRSRPNIIDMPGTMDGRSVCSALADLLAHTPTRPLIKAVVEKVTSRPRQAGAFSFGFYTGLVHGALASQSIPIVMVTPQEWKRALGLAFRPQETGPENKSRSRALATQLFPEMREVFKRAKDDGRAEALLIAVYYYHKTEGGKNEPIIASIFE